MGDKIDKQIFTKLVGKWLKKVVKTGVKMSFGLSTIDKISRRRSGTNLNKPTYSSTVENQFDQVLRKTQLDKTGFL